MALPVKNRLWHHIDDFPSKRSRQAERVKIVEPFLVLFSA
jgi:hypothetical protein